ncbi:MAG: class IV adenylate cyclase [Candidatus Pacebacteria bacterium]|nr:class IV adenylate cyclase [Candidatus Paceibacterota bacterium]
MKEIEVKFKIRKPSGVRKILQKEKTKYLGKAFERTFRFEKPDDFLSKKGTFLRTRKGFKNTITLKKKIINKHFKEREEIELEIFDIEKMNTILKELGFTKVNTMEKYREKWLIGGCEVVMDKLPKIGTFLEIEGSPQKIKIISKKLGLNFKEKINDTYWDLWNEYWEDKKTKRANISFSKK